MLAKKNRISKSRDIDFTYKTKFQFRTEFVKLFLQRNATINFKLLVVISKKVLNKSTNRNTLRRRISAVFENLKTGNRLPPSISLLVLINDSKISLMNKNELEQHILPAVASVFKSFTNSQNQHLNNSHNNSSKNQNTNYHSQNQNREYKKYI